MVLVFFLGSCPFLFFFDIDSFSFSYCENKCKKSAQLNEFCWSIRGHVDAGMVTGLDPGYHGEGKGVGTKGERGTVRLLSRHLLKLYPGVCCKGYQGWTCSWKSWANFFKRLLLPDEIVCYRLHNPTGTFCVWAKALKQTGDWHTDGNSSILVHETFECRGPLTLGVRGFFFRAREKKRGKAFSHFPEKKETSGTEA